MNCDAAFTIGKTHQVCEDYASTYKQDYRLAAVLCDGCSSSEMTDVGARILALTALETLSKYYDVYDKETIKFLIVLITKLQYQADNYFKYFPNTMFDVTLLMSNYCPEKQEVKVVSIGDGFIVAKHRTKGLLMFKTEYPSGYPRYLSYELDPIRKSEFDAINEGAIVSKLWQWQEENWHVCWQNNKTVYFSYRFTKEEFEWVGIFSDGLDTFKRKNEDGSTTAIECEDVIEEITDFKTFTGDFVKRRLNRFVKDCGKKNWVYDDDISMAVIYMGE